MNQLTIKKVTIGIFAVIVSLQLAVIAKAQAPYGRRQPSESYEQCCARTASEDTRTMCRSTGKSKFQAGRMACRNRAQTERRFREECLRGQYAPCLQNQPR